MSAQLRSDRLVQKFVLKYLDDRSFELLCASMAEKNYEETFRTAHTIKGICQNLSFTKILASSNRLSDVLRRVWTPEADTYFEEVKTDQLTVIAAIEKFRSEMI